MKTFIIFACFLLISLTTMAQQTMPLYEGVIPGAKPGPDNEVTDHGTDGILRVSKISRPTLTVYLPEKSKTLTTAIIIFPGGGYGINAIGHEGYDVAKWLQKEGIAAFVVKYRIPDTATMDNKEIGPLQDAEQAIFLVRSKAKTFGIDPKKVGVMGFSAGGHLSSTLSTHYRNALINSGKISMRPDFTVLIYPVISFSDSIGHIGSRKNLLGEHPSKEKIDAYSNQLLVDKETPPAFLAHAKDDPINYQNSIVYADALKKYHIPVELMLFEKGGHGFGMHNQASKTQWPDELIKWMKKTLRN